MRILLLSGILLMSAHAFSQMAGRDNKRHGLSFTTGQNKNVFTDTTFRSNTWRSHISTGWTYVHYMNFHFGFQTGFWLSTTRTAFDVNNNVFDSDQYPGANTVIYNEANGLEVTKKPFVNLQEVADAYPYFYGDNQILRDHIESEYSIEIPTMFVFSSNFMGAIRLNTKAGVVSKLNVFRTTGLREEQILGGFIYRNYIRPRNKTAANFNGQFSLGFEWNYVSTRSLAFDFSYRTNLTSLYKKGDNEQYLMIVSNDSAPVDPTITFLETQARRHQFALTISTQF